MKNLKQSQRDAFGIESRTLIQISERVRDGNNKQGTLASLLLL